MEDFFLHKEIKTFCVTAETFPAGVMDAHKKLYALLPSVPERNFFGISWGKGGGTIIYKAPYNKSMKAKLKNMAVKFLYSGRVSI